MAKKLKLELRQNIRAKNKQASLNELKLQKQPLLAEQLATKLGVESATNEVRWMRERLEERERLYKETFKILKWEHMVRRRISGVPLQYILGTQPFGPLQIACKEPVLIPRPETEHWVTRLAERMRPSAESPISMLDLCTGTGCIPLLLAHLWPPGSLRALGLDSSGKAVALAERNVKKLGTNESAIEVIRADLFNIYFAPGLPKPEKPFALLTCNPPYIPAEAYDALDDSVRKHEDRMALRGDPPGAPWTDGLTFYRRIAGLLPDLSLEPGATVAFEFGEGQAEAVGEIMERDGGVEGIEIWKDQYERERVLVGRTSASSRQ